MALLALPSLEVQGFRGFQDLRIEKLGRVNLIVGKNNIGKTSLLKAIELYATRANPSVLWPVLGTYDKNPKLYQWRRWEDALLAIKYLFFGRKEITGPTNPIKIGPIDNLEQELQILIDFYTAKVDGPTWRKLPTEAYNTAENTSPRFAIFFGTFFKTFYYLNVP